MNINIGLLGYGTVGSSVYSILKEDKESIKNKMKRTTGQDFDINIKKILIRDIDKYDDKIKDKMTEDIEDILQDSDIDIVVELIGGDKTASDYMRRAMDKGKDIVTANKMALFNSQGELIEYARKKDVSFRYEAAVAGVIPVIRVVEESLVGDDIYELQGILNGSTNFIMTKIKEGMSYDDAIKMANDNGYLEADPSSDILGFDAMYKLGILANLIEGEFPKEEDIKRIGIDSISKEDIESADKNNKKIKLIGRIGIEDGKNIYSVKPELVDKDNPLYNVDGSLNGILLKGKNSGEIFLSGAGAGGNETAISVIGDIVSIIRSEYNE